MTKATCARVRVTVRFVRSSVCRRETGWMLRIVVDIGGRRSCIERPMYRTLYGARMAERAWVARLRLALREPSWGPR